MNYNARPGIGPGGRKVKRVSDVNAMGAPAPNVPPQYMADPFAAAGNYGAGAPYAAQSSVQQPEYAAFATTIGGDYAEFNAMPQAQQHQQQQQQQSHQQPQQPHPTFQQSQQPLQAPMPPVVGPAGPAPTMMFNPNTASLGMFQQPIVQDMAMQYGQRLADQGKQMVESQIEKYLPLTRLKYYFAVDNKYVMNKLRLLFFPFTHTDWSLRYDEDHPVQPRYDLNAPDLYIPTMAYITYVVLAGFVLGMQQRFTPEDLGKQSSTALAVLLLELLVYTVVLYVTQIPTTLKTLDLLAYTGYKFVAMTSCIIAGILINGPGYWVTLLYCNAALAFFMTRTLYMKLKWSGNATATDVTQHQPTYDAYGNVMPGAAPKHQDYNAARTRKLYFTGFLVGLQVLVTWWLTRYLIAPTSSKLML